MYSNESKFNYIHELFMSNLKNKSEISLDSAKLLHKNGLYPSVAHCSYYSCYQVIKHIWLHVMSKSESDLASLTRNETRGSHEVLINQVGLYLKEKIEISDYRTFNSSILQLKKLRTTADYDDKGFDIEKSQNSISLAESSHKLIRRLV